MFELAKIHTDLVKIIGLLEEISDKLDGSVSPVSRPTYPSVRPGVTPPYRPANPGRPWDSYPNVTWAVNCGSYTVGGAVPRVPRQNLSSRRVQDMFEEYDEDYS